MPPAAARRRWPLRLAIAIVAVVLGADLLRQGLLLWVEREAFTTPPPGALTPDALGAPSTRLDIESGENRLRASFVATPDPAAPALLVFHGDDEELSRWAGVQRDLRAAGIASLVFDYSGYGASGGRPGVAQLTRDGIAAYRRFVELTPQASRRVVLGFSLGAAVLLDGAAQFQPPPDGVLLAGAFVSAREIAAATGAAPRWAVAWLPDLWNNERAIARLRGEPLLVHSRADEVVPFDDALRLCRALHGHGRLLAVDGLSHDAPWKPDEAARFWAPLIDSIRSGRWPANALSC